MALTRISVLQLGDIHFPEASKSPLTADLKDQSFPAVVSQRIALTPLQTVIREIQSLLDRDNIDVIAMMGDLTSRGDKVEFDKCLRFLRSALWERTGKPFSAEKVLIVPGNHDVNHKDAQLPDLELKFKHINEALVSAGIGPVGVDIGATVNASKGNCQLLMFGINTCIGCGTMRALPGRVARQVASLYDEKLQDAKLPEDINALYDDLYEQLDAPAVSEATVQWVVKEAGSTDGAVLVCGHHNILPQATPRISPYTELINSGQMRHAFLGSGRKLIYLHGHIHNNPIEAISIPTQPSALLVAISAPLLTDGFNILQFEFGGTGQPLGCMVKRYLVRSGVVECVDTIPVALHADGGVAPSDVQIGVLNVINERRIMYWRELVETMVLEDSVLIPVVMELMWKQRLTLERNGEDPLGWIIRRAY